MHEDKLIDHENPTFICEKYKLNDSLNNGYIAWTRSCCNFNYSIYPRRNVWYTGMPDLWMKIQ